MNKMLFHGSLPRIISRSWQRENMDFPQNLNENTMYKFLLLWKFPRKKNGFFSSAARLSIAICSHALRRSNFVFYVSCKAKFIIFFISCRDSHKSGSKQISYHTNTHCFASIGLLCSTTRIYSCNDNNRAIISLYWHSTEFAKQTLLISFANESNFS